MSERKCVIPNKGHKMCCGYHERLITLQAEKIKGLAEEITRLNQIIETGESLLKSANYDVKRLSEYADKLEAEIKDLLIDFVSQNCRVSGCEELDSFAISTNADAMRRLAELGIIEIKHECGRRVIGNWTKTKPAPPPEQENKPCSE